MDPGPLDSGEMRESVDRVFNKYRRLVSLPLDFGTGEGLFPSEIHMIEAVGKGRADTVTGLAAHLGVTKGAVSQTVSKLRAKGYLLRGEREVGSKEQRLELTGEGKRAYRTHERLHARFDASMSAALSGESPGDIAAFLRLLGKLEKLLDEWSAMLESGH